jgi:hypothetical protein
MLRSPRPDAGHRSTDEGKPDRRHEDVSAHATHVLRIKRNSDAIRIAAYYVNLQEIPEALTRIWKSAHQPTFIRRVETLTTSAAAL